MVQSGGASRRGAMWSAASGLKTQKARRRAFCFAMTRSLCPGDAGTHELFLVHSKPGSRSNRVGRVQLSSLRRSSQRSSRLLMKELLDLVRPGLPLRALPNAAPRSVAK